MFCRRCGSANAENAYQCASCGEILTPAGPGATAQRVPNYLAQAILVTLFCCLPFGIVAIVYAAQVNSKFQGGDYAGALDASRKAKTWCWASFGVGLPIALIWIGINVISAIVAIRQGH